MMTRFSSWAGWVTLIFSVLAALIVAHALIVRSHALPQPTRHFSLGATLSAEDMVAGSRLVVTSLKTGGLGAAHGLKVGDEIEDVDGLPAPTLLALERDIATGPPDVIHVRIKRGSAILDLPMPRTGSETKG